MRKPESNPGNFVKRNSVDDVEKNSLCVLILKNSTTSISDKLKDVSIFQKKTSPDLVESIKEGHANLFENYKFIRFGIIDLDKQRKFKNLIENLSAKNGHQVPTALAIISENQKYFVYNEKSNQMFKKCSTPRNFRSFPWKT